MSLNKIIIIEGRGRRENKMENYFQNGRSYYYFCINGHLGRFSLLTKRLWSSWKPFKKILFYFKILYLFHVYFSITMFSPSHLSLHIMNISQSEVRRGQSGAIVYCNEELASLINYTKAKGWKGKRIMLDEGCSWLWKMLISAFLNEVKTEMTQAP